MPIKVTGPVGKDQYDGPVTAKKIIDLFDLQDLKRNKIEFISNSVWDRVNNRRAHPHSLNLKCQFVATTQAGDQIEITYYKQKVNKIVGNNNVEEYIPHNTQDSKMPFVGSNIALNSITDLELALFYYLNPKCKSSPFRKPDEGFLYDIHMPEKLAEEELGKRKALFEAQNLIYNLKGDDLKFLARGISIKTGPNTFRGISNVANLNDNEIRLQLIRLSEINHVSFMQQFRSGSTKVFGFLQSAIDERVIYLSRPHTAGQTWRWNENIGGHDIVNVPPGRSPVEVIRQYFLENMESIMPVIQENLGKKMLEGQANKPENISLFEKMLSNHKEETTVVPTIESSGKEIFDYLFDNGYIILEKDEGKETGKVYLTDRARLKVGNTLVKIKQTQVWQNEVIAMFDNKNNMAPKRAISHISKMIKD